MTTGCVRWGGAVLWAVLGAGVAAAYDPLAAGPEPEVWDCEVVVGPGRTIPVRIFLPAGSEPAPVIVFSHGLGGSREGSNSYGRHWASRGLVTVFVQHPGSDESVWQGKSAPRAIAGMRQAANVEQFRQRLRDVAGLLDELARRNVDEGSVVHSRLDLERVGMAGHSFGAMTTQALAGMRWGRPGRSIETADPRIKAALPMSPSPPERGDPTWAFAQVSIPWLLMTGTRDDAPRSIRRLSPADRLKVYPALPPGDKYELVLEGADHFAFTDSDPVGARPRRRDERHQRAIVAISTAFWEAYLAEESAAQEWLREEVRTVLVPGDRWRSK
jgi:predicted dienelactone hydrolase